MGEGNSEKMFWSYIVLTLYGLMVQKSRDNCGWWG